MEFDPARPSDLEAWVDAIASRLVEELPEGCASTEHQTRDEAGRDATTVTTIRPRGLRAATIVLFTYASTRTLEVFVGRGLSFLFEGLTTAEVTHTDREVMSLCRSVIAGHVTERVTTVDGRVVSIEGVVETPSGPLPSGHVAGPIGDDASVDRIEYAPYCEAG